MIPADEVSRLRHRLNQRGAAAPSGSGSLRAELSLAAEELRVQQEELTQMRGVLELTRADYDEVFLRSSVAHILTTRGGLITRMNRAASALISVPAVPGTQTPISNAFPTASRRIVRALTSRALVTPGWHTGRADLDDNTAVTIAVISSLRSSDFGALRWTLRPVEHPTTDSSRPPTRTDSLPVHQIRELCRGLISSTDLAEVASSVMERAVPALVPWAVAQVNAEDLSQRLVSAPALRADLESRAGPLIDEVLATGRSVRHEAALAVPVIEDANVDVVLVFLGADTISSGIAEAAEILTDEAAIRLRQARRNAGVDDLERQIADLRQALTTNRQIGTAIGIVMHTEALSENEAFEHIKALSQAQRRKIRDIAAQIVSEPLPS